MSETTRGRIVILDLGVASWTDKHLSDNMQPEHLRAPEVILGAPWDPPVDIWSLGCLVMEFVKGHVAFLGAASEGRWSSEDDHLAQHMEVLGRMPSRLLLRGSKTDQYFDKEDTMAQVFQKAMEAAPASSSTEHLRKDLATKDSLAAVLTKSGRWDEAEAILREVLKARETLGQTIADEDMLMTMNNLGAVLNSQGRFSEAEILHRQVLEADEKSLGSEHTDTITSMNNLADVLTRQGKLDEAEPMQRQVVALSKQVRGPEHPETLSAMGNLGDILLRQKKYEEAETVSQAALELRRKVLREGHPEIASSLNNLAAVLSKRGKFDEAEALHREQYALAQTNLEKIGSMSGLARFLSSRGHYDEAETLLQDAVKMSTGELGPNHPTTRSAMSDLGDVLLRNGKYQGAEDVQRKILRAGVAVA
ncbi:hypothetical protein LTR91_003154 [Friedmanniomyces endolithicus]|uniref:Protein kinase domain-containing protein n=2 Tax=Friedmanniomyces endolithicus TaxID=329885 RepID=A0AAN6KXF2_9PEZI|nr:hypothetical protein LTR91_003154 [Friedmanniomyces endolithicus]